MTDFRLAASTSGGSRDCPIADFARLEDPGVGNSVRAPPRRPLEGVICFKLASRGVEGEERGEGGGGGGGGGEEKEGGFDRRVFEATE